MSDGWNPGGILIDGMAQMMEGVRGMAREAGRDSSTLKMVVRANVHVTPQSQGDQRAVFSGSLDEIKSDIQATKKIGAHELIFDPSFSSDGRSVEGFLKSMEQMKQLAEGT